MRGEYLIIFAYTVFYKGSPPHAWRIHLKQRNIELQQRITSTCVENTRFIPPITINDKDHLHMRGEYYIGTISVKNHRGSPPHAWRILKALEVVSVLQGITSTCVENTWLSGETGDTYEDHLHMRGEYPPSQQTRL